MSELAGVNNPSESLEDVHDVVNDETPEQSLCAGQLVRVHISIHCTLVDDINEVDDLEESD